MKPHWTAPAGTMALIFDCDGTLADTMPIHYRAWQAILDPIGIPFSTKRFYQLGGMPTAQIIRLLATENHLPVPEIEPLVHRKESIFLQFLGEVQALEPIVAIARHYRTLMPMAVASGGYREIVDQTLVAIGIKDWFGAMVCAEDTAKHKPEPDVFLEAARRLGITNPNSCVVFEDTDIGLEAARRANMTGIDVRPWLPARSGEER